MDYADLGYNRPADTEEVCHYCGETFIGDMGALKEHYTAWGIPFAVHCSKCTETHLATVVV